MDPWVDPGHASDGYALLHAGEVVLVARTSWPARPARPARPAPEDRTICGIRTCVVVSERKRAVAAVVATKGEPLYPPSVESVDSRIDLTTQRWRQWSEQRAWGPTADRLVRSALALTIRAIPT